MKLSKDSINKIKSKLNQNCEVREDELTRDCPSLENSFDRAEEEVRNEMIDKLTTDFDDTCSTYGFDCFEEFDWVSPQENEGFACCLVMAILKWRYE